ncbi:MAG: alpha/beta hydrolase [Erysipelotrichaceae bacterium]|nr:alpha/beta hydrolase [Erysipelotrichaceae bacterium]
MKINYIKFGTGDKTMLILPGLSVKPICAAPKPVIDAYEPLSEDFTIYLFDQRTDMPEGYDFDQMVEDVYAKIEELDLKDIYLYGVSMGGIMAMLLTAKYPQVIKKLVLCSTCYKGNDQFREWYDFAKAKDSYKLVDSFMDLVYSKQFNEKFKEATMVAFKDISDEEFKRFAIQSKALLETDISEYLPELRNKEILLLGSKQDKVIPYEQMLDLAERLGCETYFYEGYAHSIYDEAPDIKDRIREFFLR